MYRRTYEWDDKNQLIKSQDDNVTVCYTYGSDGQRASKYTENSETLYTNDFWVFHVSGSVRNGAGIINKNIYLGKMRVVTKVKEAFDAMEITERQCQYFYHSDHLGSAQLVTDNKGNEYQRIEYTPYGETWIDLKATQNDLVKLNYKFTAKELDEETGLYYYGARYLNPKYSMWISCDPALGEYFPVAPTSEDARSHNQNLPGLGGVFNTVNLNLYHYAANNPVRYVDPVGLNDEDYLDLWQEFSDIFESSSIGIRDELSINIPNIVSFTIEINFISTNTSKNEDNFMNSGINIQFSLGSETLPIFNFEAGVEKKVYNATTPFDLIGFSYEPYSEVEINKNF